MKKYKFEIIFTEEDVSGDEFWEDAIESDPTGVNPLVDYIHDLFVESNLFSGTDKKISDMIKLVEFKDTPQ